MNVRPTGILSHGTKEIVFVPFLNFPGNPSAGFPNSFDSQFCQRSFVFFLILAFNPCTVSSTICLDK